MDIKLFTTKTCNVVRFSLNCPNGNCLREIVLDEDVFNRSKTIECFTCGTQYEIKKKLKKGPIVKLEPVPPKDV